MDKYMVKTFILEKLRKSMQHCYSEQFMSKIKDCECDEDKFKMYDQVVAIKMIEERRSIRRKSMRNNLPSVQDILGVFYREVVEDDYEMPNKDQKDEAE